MSEEITFCVRTMIRTPWFKKCLSSIQRHCPTEYRIKILSQGEPDADLTEKLTSLADERIELIVSPINLGYGGARRVLSRHVNSPFIMMLDDDVYLTDGAIAQAMRVLRRSSRVGAVSMPQYDLQGRMISRGGRKLVIKNGVISFRNPELNMNAEWAEAEDLDGGAMLYRTQMREAFSWDPEVGAFEDLDKSLQIIRDNRWKQAIVSKGRLIHDRSWLGQTPNYERYRLDGLAWRRSYRLFRAKWGLRLELRVHLLHELIYPIFYSRPFYPVRCYFRNLLGTRPVRSRQPL